MRGEKERKEARKQTNRPSNHFEDACWPLCVCSASAWRRKLATVLSRMRNFYFEGNLCANHDVNFHEVKLTCSNVVTIGYCSSGRCKRDCLASFGATFGLDSQFRKLDKVRRSYLNYCNGNSN